MKVFLLSVKWNLAGGYRKHFMPRWLLTLSAWLVVAYMVVNESRDAPACSGLSFGKHCVAMQIKLSPVSRETESRQMCSYWRKIDCFSIDIHLLFWNAG